MATMRLDYAAYPTYSNSKPGPKERSKYLRSARRIKSKFIRPASDQSLRQRSKLAKWSDMCEYAIMEAVAEKVINDLINEILKEFNNGS